MLGSFSFTVNSILSIFEGRKRGILYFCIKMKGNGAKFVLGSLGIEFLELGVVNDIVFLRNFDVFVC